MTLTVLNVLNNWLPSCNLGCYVSEGRRQHTFAAMMDVTRVGGKATVVAERVATLRGEADCCQQ